jgi:hypothetical protein
VSTELELTTQIAIAKKDLEEAKKRTAIVQAELETTRKILMNIVSIIVNEVGDR